MGKTKDTSKPKEGKHPGGRPTKYKPEFCDLIIKFFSTPAFEVVVVESSVEYFKDGGLKKQVEKKKPMPNKMPTFFGFARSIGVDQTSIPEWVKKFPEFSLAYKAAKQLQKEWLIANGLSGASPSAAFIFTAKNVTDMRDKMEVQNDITSNIKYFKLPQPYAKSKNGYTDPGVGVDTASRSANKGTGV